MAKAAVEPRKHPVQDRSRQTVDRILAEAARIFDEHGYRRTTTNRVAEAAGVSVGSLYQYFPNKDALLVALAERHVDEITHAFQEHLAHLDRTAPTIEGVLRSLLDLTLGLNSTSRLHALLFTDCPRTPALEERLARFTGAVVEGVAHHLRRTGARGRPSSPCRAAGRGLRRSRAHGGPASPPRAVALGGRRRPRGPPPPRPLRSVIAAILTFTRTKHARSRRATRFRQRDADLCGGCRRTSSEERFSWMVATPGC